MSQAKPYQISKWSVWKAWTKVKENAGAAGIDGQTIREFEERLKSNLYKIWNRMSSGSYFPPAVREVEIPKKNGGTRKLGIPTVADRIAQTVVRDSLEPELEPHFHPDSYAYRPGRSALEAIGVTRKRCWKYDWVLEFDIKSAFDNIDHEWMMKAVKHHTQEAWIILYVERWLKASILKADGARVERTQGTPQGGVISPLLFNLYLHYAFDTWMQRNHPHLPFARYADDGLVHCRSEREAVDLEIALGDRFKECGLEMHPDKTRIVYCQDANRRQTYPVCQFDFLGYTFRGRLAKSRDGKYFCSFSPAVSKKSARHIHQVMRDWRLPRWTTATLEQIAEKVNPVLRGWYQYYARYYPTNVRRFYQHFNYLLLKWVRRKYRRFRYTQKSATQWLRRLAERDRKVFFHWDRLGILPTAG